MAISDLLPGTPGSPGSPVPPFGQPVTPVQGVATVWDVPNTISADLQRQVQLELDKLNAGQSTALLNVDTHKGVNLVVASKIGDRLVATAWIGKSGWDRPMTEGWEGAVSVRASWGGK